MIYDNAVEQVKGAKQVKIDVFHLATVTSLDDSGRAYVQFYGDSAPSGKLYPYIEGLRPAVNDTVLMAVQGSTYVIIGKVTKDGIVETYYLTKEEADQYYLTQTTADTLYEPKDTFHSAIVAKSAGVEWAMQIRLDGSIIGARQNYGSYVGADLGTKASQFSHGYFVDLGYDTFAECVQNLYVKNTKLYGDMMPSSDNSRNLGSSSVQFKAGYFKTLGGTTQQTAVQDFNVKNAVFHGNLEHGSTTVTTYNIGSSTHPFNNVYAKQFYQNGSPISTSDKRKKKTIKDIAKSYIEFFKKLRPRTYKFKDGESGRTHTGFIAQEVEEAASEVGIDSKDLGFLCIGPDGNYGLRYEELIAIQTKIIQDLMQRVENLENKMKERS